MSAFSASCKVGRGSASHALWEGNAGADPLFPYEEASP